MQTQATEEEIRQYIPKHQNRAPLNYREIQESEFAILFFSKSIAHHEYRQITHDFPGISVIGRAPLDARIFLFNDNTGVIIGKPLREPHKIIYYRFGCNHDYDVNILGPCYRSFVCTECGHKTLVDSAD